MTHTLTIPDWRPALTNELFRVHWMVRSALKRKDRDTIGLLAKQAEIPRATTKRRVSVHVTLPRVPCDPDAPLKSLLDALVAARLLIDDSEEWCELGELRASKGKKCTIITLEDVPAEPQRK